MDIILHKFEFGNLINVIKKAKAHKKEDLIICKPFDENSIPYVTRTEPNNSVECFIKNTKELKIEKGNAIVVGDTTATVSYQLQPFVAGDHIVVIYADWLNQWTGLYITCLLNKERYKYCYGRAYVVDSIKSTSIYLPSKLDDNNQYIPDWQYMENIIKEKYKKLNKGIITKIKSKPNSLIIPRWKLFKVSDIFDEIVSTKGATTDDLIKGREIAYIGATKSMNGLMDMVAKEGNEEFISKGNCIVFIQIGAGGAGYATYQEKDFIGMSGKTCCGYSEHLNKYNGMFIDTILCQERFRYSFGRSWTGGRLLNTEIKLPAKLNSKNEYEPDWQFMEEYIKSLPYSDVI